MPQKRPKKISDLDPTSTAGKHPITDEEAAALAEDKLRQGYAPSTAAGEFVHEVFEKEQLGQFSTVSRAQAVAIGLSKARHAGVIPPRTRAAARKEMGEATSRPLSGAALIAKGIKKPASPRAERMREFAALPADVRVKEGYKYPRIYSEEPTTDEEVPLRGVRAKMVKPKAAVKGKSINAPPASSLGGMVSGARIHAAHEGEDPEVGAKRARAVVDEIQRGAMTRNVRSR